MPMLPVSAAELASIQADAVSAVCDKVCYIYRHTTNTPDAYGSSTPTYTLINTTVAGMSEPSGNLLANFDYLIGSLATWELKFPVNTDIQHQDHAVIDGQTLEIHVVRTPRSYEALLTCLAAEIK